MQRAAEEVGIAAFDAICSAQKDRRLGASDLTLPYNAINQQRQERPRYLSTDQPDTRSRSLLSRSRVSRAVEAARRVGGGLVAKCKSAYRPDDARAPSSKVDAFPLLGI